jgi:hypothetical protein
MAVNKDINIGEVLLCYNCKLAPYVITLLRNPPRPYSPSRSRLCFCLHCLHVRRPVQEEEEN